MLQCPHCNAGLTDRKEPSLPCSCDRVFPRLRSGGWDFLPGEHFPDFHLDLADPAQQELLDQEAAGVSWRVESFILPMIRRYSEELGLSEKSLEILDCGCGSGISVEILRAHSLAAFGIDAGNARQEQWGQRSSGRHLHTANALHLPFRDLTFDVILSSGLVEHIGIHEEESAGYRSRRLPDCAAQRQRFVSELVRVLKPDGFILLDHPNGDFPADFWHGGTAGAIRWHFSSGDMLPGFREISRYFGALESGFRLLPFSPVHRLRFNQVSGHWYGRVFSPFIRAWLRVMDQPALRFLARTFVNPYLVTVATRQGEAGRWAYPKRSA